MITRSMKIWIWILPDFYFIQLHDILNFKVEDTCANRAFLSNANYMLTQRSILVDNMALK